MRYHDNPGLSFPSPYFSGRNYPSFQLACRAVVTTNLRSNSVADHRSEQWEYVIYRHVAVSAPSGRGLQPLVLQSVETILDSQPVEPPSCQIQPDDTQIGGGVADQSEWSSEAQFRVTRRSQEVLLFACPPRCASPEPRFVCDGCASIAISPIQWWYVQPLQANCDLIIL
ncbi:hypothetical protein BGW80DRAFT_1337769 [Lactifluus volemus]|nr:hypothetical protein BGW80DRAFT_1337769 [Lactifluus volemus]